MVWTTRTLPSPILPSQPTPTIPFDAYAQRRTQDIMGAGPYSILNVGGGIAPIPAPMITTSGSFVNKLRNGTMDVWQRGNTVSSIVSLPTYCADGWIQYWNGTVGTAARAAGRGPTLYSMQLGNTSGIYGDTVISQRIESQIACALGGGNCTFQAQIQMLSDGLLPGYPKLSVGHPTTQDTFSTPIIWDVQNISLQPCPIGDWTQIAYTFNFPAASAALGIVVQLDFGAVIQSGGNYVCIAECDLRATPSLSVGLISNPPAPELRPYTIENLICCAYYQNVPTLPMFFGQIVAGQQYYATDEFVTPMRVAPTIVTLDVQNSFFPAGAPVVNYFDINGFRVSKTATTTAVGPGFYIFGYTATAEL